MLLIYVMIVPALLGRYFDEISQDTGKYCFGVEDTLKALELGAVEILICWENLDIMRYMLKIPGTEATKILHLTPEQQKDNSHFTDKEVDYFKVTYFISVSHTNLLIFDLHSERNRNGVNGKPTFP